ncbi:MAG TPA: hypothetical protein VG826_13515 [Pirellulales bacterium]|nr:hypothetical protein [Pirellulales bacterium]
MPLVAGAWPFVRAVVNRYNDDVHDGRRRLAEAAAALEGELRAARAGVEHYARLDENSTTAVRASAAPGAIDKLVEAIARVEDRLNRFRAEMPLKTIAEPLLPWSWAVAFFAALCIALGHVVYEAVAPEAIKAGSADSFVSRRLDEYARHPSPGLIEVATAHLRASTCGRELLTRYEAPDFPVTEEVDMGRRLELVRAGATAEYEAYSARSACGRGVCTALYGIGLLLLSALIYQQCRAVASAAGWVGP